MAERLESHGSPHHLPHLERAHSRAICREIGERLRFDLDQDTSPLPSRLRELVHQFDQLDARGDWRQRSVVS